MILACINPKGGVGKTTTAVNLAAALAEKGLRVALVDLDDQMYASRWAAVEPSDTLFHAMLKREPLTLLPSPLGFDVAPGCEGLSRLSQEVLASFELRAGQFTLLKEALEPVSERYDYIILDCPGDLDDITVNAIFACTAALIVLQTAYLSFSSYGTTYQQLQRLAKAQKRALPTKLLFGMYQAQKRLHRDVVEQVKQEAAPDMLLQTIIPHNVRLEEAASHKQSILTYAPTSPGAQAFRELADEITTWRP